MVRLRIKRLGPPRRLRSYRRGFSQRPRVCWDCQYPIEVGDEYYAEVWVCPGGQVRFCVHTMHIECPHGRFDEQEEPIEAGEEEAQERAA